MQRDEYYERHLPHAIPANMPIFLTWSLKGAVTREIFEQTEQERLRLQRQPERQGEARAARRVREGKLIFGFQDSLLGKTDRGPMYLADPAAAQIVVESIVFGVPERYALYAYVVMANHAHVLLTPVWRLEMITQGIKGYTAYQINALQRQRGRVFWQDESYDHWVRDDEELLRIIAYIENNPVVAGRCARPEDWPWSSARLRDKWLVGQPFQADMAAWKAHVGSQAGKPDGVTVIDAT